MALLPPDSGIIFGDDRDNMLVGTVGKDTIWGEGGNDVIYGDYLPYTVITVMQPGANPVATEPPPLSALGNGDVIHGGAGSDFIYGQGGNDTIYGDSGNDFLYGDSGNDRLVGGTGNDDLYGGEGKDVLLGGAGADMLAGGAGADTLTGGAGHDAFVFDVRDIYKGSADTVTDFVKGVDSLYLSITADMSDAVQHAINDFVKIKSVGADTVISFDFDGKGGEAAVAMAVLKNVHLSQSDLHDVLHIQTMMQPPG